MCLHLFAARLAFVPFRFLFFPPYSLRLQQRLIIDRCCGDVRLFKCHSLSRIRTNNHRYYHHVTTTAVFLCDIPMVVDEWDVCVYM